MEKMEKNGYQIALERIEEARRTGAEELELNGLGLTELPHEIGELKNLTSLYFSDGQISDLSPIAELKKLAMLYFANNHVIDLAPLAELKNLNGLGFSRNQITDLAPIAELKFLRVLDFSQNQITDIAPIAALNNLAALDFSQNQITELEPLVELKNLTVFDSSKNKIRRFPIQFLHLQKPIIWPEVDDGFYDESINVSHNPFTEPPAEIMRLGNAAIARYFENPRRRLAELKIILVGEGAAGKTSLIRRLLDDRFDPNESQTHGIVIRKEPLERFGCPTTGRFWDFGGQEIMHATHRFFLSERSIYLLVINCRTGENPDYWLRHVETYGGGRAAKCLIALNKTDENPAFDLDRRALREKYPFIEGFFPVSAKTGAGVAELRAALLRLVGDHQLAESMFPTDWLEAKNLLENADDDYISYGDFRKIVARAGVADEQSQEFLLRALNDLGVALHFENLRGFDTQVLNPLWLTSAVYRIINSNLLGDERGILRVSRVGEMLADPRFEVEKFRFPKEKWLYIVRIMEQFELCFESERDLEFIVPERLPAAGEANVPLDAKGEKLIRMTVKYPEFMPTSIFPQLMVRTNRLLAGQNRWRSAMRLEEKDLFQAEARITADRDARTVAIEVAGKNPRGFLSYLRKELEAIRSGFASLNSEEWVPIDDKTSVKYSTLLAHENKNRTAYFSPELERDFSVAELLDGIEEKETRSDEARMPVSVFISYAHADEQDFEALKMVKNQLMPHVRLGNAQLWDDGAIRIGENWMQSIWRNFEQADVIVCLISPSFIASDFCFEKELAAALAAHEKGEKVIFPVRLIDCAWSDLPISKIQAAPVGGWLNPGEKGEPRHELWAEMGRKFNDAMTLVKRRKLERQRRERGGGRDFER